jgi:hypothetical protein
MTTWKITALVANYTGEVAGCAFANSRYEGPASTGALNYFRSAGYGVEEVVAEPAEEVVDDPPAELPAKSAPKPDWVAAAIARGYDAGDAEKATKEQLVELLTSEESKA